MLKTQLWDLVVIGGGPAGSTVATFVAMQGHRVLLLEALQFPRYQIGESLLPSTVHGICRMLGVAEDLKNANFVRKHGAAFRWGESKDPWVFGFTQSRLLEMSKSDFAYQVERSRFDSILLENARSKGVTVLEECKVKDLIIRDNRIVGVRYVVRDSPSEFTAFGRYTVDGSGNTSVTSRHVGRRIYSRFFQNVALFCYYYDGGRLPPPNQGNILCEAFDRGWMWYIPLRHDQPTLTSVGAVIDHKHAAIITDRRDLAMSDFISSCPNIASLLRSAHRVTEGQYGTFRIRKDWSYLTERFWRPGLLLVGDAACFIDPVLSTGVHLATYSALLAARTVNTFLRNKCEDESLYEVFESRYRAEFAMLLNFLIAFYDMHGDQSSFYWTAKKVMNSDESANEAFVRLVAGGGTAPELFMSRKSGIGSTLQRFANQLDFCDPSGRRSEVTAELARELHAFHASSSPGIRMHAGTADIASFTWGESDELAGIAVDGFSGSSDGLHWKKVE